MKILASIFFLEKIGIEIKATASSEICGDPLLSTWTGPHKGYPRFDKIDVSKFRTSISNGIELKRKEIFQITARKKRVNFKNILEPLENSGRGLNNAVRLLSIYTSTMSDEQMQLIESEVVEMVSQANDDFLQNDDLFQCIKSVYLTRNRIGLTTEQIRLVEKHFKMFERAGANLSYEKKLRLRNLNGRLAALYTSFRQNLLADEEQHMLVLEQEKDLQGLPDFLRQEAAEAAALRDLPGKWVIQNTRSSMEPFLTYSARRDLRKQGWEMWTRRGDNGDANDNKKNVAEILTLRAERASILGFSSHAHFALDGCMAKSPEIAMKLLMDIWAPAKKKALSEIADAQKIAREEGLQSELEPWDYRYYAEKVRKANFDFDQNEVREFLQLDKILDGLFWTANQAYGLSFSKVSDVPVLNVDVLVFEVRHGGKQIGLWYFDPYSRDGKISSAWMNEYRNQEKFCHTVTPIESNNCNFIKSPKGQPTLISWDDAITLFHEFGHALHGLLSDVNYPSLAGINVVRDFVEFPSQVNERWLLTEELLSKFAVHYKTGSSIPTSLINKIKNAKTFNQGFRTTEYLASAIFDLSIHLSATPATAIDPDTFEINLLKEIGCPKEIPMRSRPTAFDHIFSDEDSDVSGYYSYIWADAMAADAADVFVQSGGFYNKKICTKFKKTILMVGNSISPEKAFKNFRGRDVSIDALMRERGFMPD